MGVYAAVLIAVILILIWSCKEGKCTKAGAIMVGAILVLAAGLRYRVGTDYVTYTYLYKGYQTADWEWTSAGLKAVALLSGVLYDDYATWFFLMSLFTVGLCVYAIYKHGEHFALGILLYLFLGAWHGSFNVVKQCAAVAVLLCGQQYLFDKKFLKWCAICLLAATFHVSAVLMIPVYFLARKKLDFTGVLLLFVVGITVALNYDFLFSLMEGLKAGQSVTSVTSELGMREVNIFRVLVACAPVVLLLVYRKYYDDSDIKLRVWANLSILNAVLFVAGMNSVYLIRFCLYTEVFNLFFIPYLLEPVEPKNTKWTVIALCLCLYAVFWWLDLAKTTDTSVFTWIFER